MSATRTWEKRRIEGALERVFPEARSIDLAGLAVDDGGFLALLRLPTRIGEASVAIHRHSPHSKSPPPEEHADVGLPHRIASGPARAYWLFRGRLTDVGTWDAVGVLREHPRPHRLSNRTGRGASSTLG